MAVDEARRRDRVAAADGLLAGVAFGDLRRFANRRDLAALHGNGRIADDAAGGIDGDQPGDVGDDEIDSLHLRSSLLYLLTCLNLLNLMLRSARSARLEAWAASPPFETPAFGGLLRVRPREGGFTSSDLHPHR